MSIVLGIASHLSLYLCRLQFPASKIHPNELHRNFCQVAVGPRCMSSSPLISRWVSTRSARRSCILRRPRFAQHYSQLPTQATGGDDRLRRLSAPPSAAAIWPTAQRHDRVLLRTGHRHKIAFFRRLSCEPHAHNGNLRCPQGGVTDTAGRNRNTYSSKRPGADTEL